MRRSTKIGAIAARTLIAASLLLACPLIVSAQTADPIYRIDLNKTQILRLPAQAGSIIIGNPDIADVTVQSPTMLFVIGRGYGETNLVILDRDGQTMMDADVQVTSITPSNGVRLFNAKSRETYSCSPYCQPSPVLGDAAGFIGANSAQTSSPLSTGTIFDTLLGTSADSNPNPSVITGVPASLAGNRPPPNVDF